MVCWPACGVRFVTVRELSAAIWAAELAPPGVVVTAPNTAIAWISERIACSLACAPYCTLCDWSMRTVDEARAVPGPELPVYQATVLAEPLTSVVADPSGELPTRSGCVADTVPVNPSAAKAAAFELVTDRPAASSACSVIAPPEMVEGAGRRRRRGRCRQWNGFGGAVRKLECTAHLSARIGIASAEGDRDRRGRAGRTGHRGPGPRRVHRTQLEAERRARDVFRHLNRRRRRRRNDEASEPAGAEIGLPTF